MNNRTLFAALIFCGAGIAMPAMADDATFYKGKQVTLVISAGSGGGYDTYGRLLARHFGRHIPGQPNLVPQNMPGAGGIRATNYMFNNASKDGSVIALVHSAMTTASILAPKKARFDATKFSWIGNMEDETSLCVSWHASPVKTTQDMLTKEFVVGGTGVGGNLEIYPRVLNSILDSKIKVISGYKGGNDVILAMERGEVHGRCSWPLSSIRSTRPEWLAGKKLNLLLQTGLEKEPDLPNVPLVMEFVKNEDDRAVMELIFASRSFLRPVLAPPGVPEGRVDALRNAFVSTMADKEFLDDARKQRLTITPKRGENMQALIGKIHRTPKAIVTRAIKAMNPE
jgi:tripartite-type tricarboxylate transporter receptor subunit TctC